MRWKTLLALPLFLMLALSGKGQDFPSPAWITIGLTNVENVCMVGWVAAAPTDAGGGSGSVGISNYTGQAFVLSAIGLAYPEMMLVECSTDMVTWHGYPSDGFQLTFLATNSVSVIVPPASPVMFFRGRITQQQGPIATIIESPMESVMFSRRVFKQPQT